MSKTRDYLAGEMTKKPCASGFLNFCSTYRFLSHTQAFDISFRCSGCNNQNHWSRSLPYESGLIELKSEYRAIFAALEARYAKRLTYMKSGKFCPNRHELSKKSSTHLRLLRHISCFQGLFKVSILIEQKCDIR